jgi:hypothetical protein
VSTWIGPVELVDSLIDPQLVFTGTPTALGLRTGQISGAAPWASVHQLLELVDNPHRRVTIGGQSGVLEPIYFPDTLLGPLTAWVLLQSMQLGQADVEASLDTLVPYTLTLASVGDGTYRQVVVVRSARAKANDPGRRPWVTDRGGDVRGYDRRRAVGGLRPRHSHFAVTTDLQVTNGLLSLLGRQHRPARLPQRSSAFRSGTWREVGTEPIGTGQKLTRLPAS